MAQGETLKDLPWGALGRFVLYAAGLVVLGDVALHRLPADDGWALFGEYGRLETIQVWLLVIAFVLATTAAMRVPATRPLTILIAGMLIALLVREHNNYFKDHHFKGLWQILVAGIVIVTLGVAWRWRQNLGPSLRALCSSPAFGWMAAAVMVAMFAQLLDEQALWELVAERDDLPYAVRRVGEESLEVVAYYLFAVGLLEYRRHASRPEEQDR